MVSHQPHLEIKEATAHNESHSTRQHVPLEEKSVRQHRDRDRVPAVLMGAAGTARSGWEAE